MRAVLLAVVLAVLAIATAIEALVLAVITAFEPHLLTVLSTFHAALMSILAVFLQVLKLVVEVVVALTSPLLAILLALFAVLLLRSALFLKSLAPFREPVMTILDALLQPVTVFVQLLNPPGPHSVFLLAVDPGLHLFQLFSLAKLCKLGSRFRDARCPGVVPLVEAVGVETAPMFPRTLVLDIFSSAAEPAIDSEMARSPGPAFSVLAAMDAVSCPVGTRFMSIVSPSGTYHQSRSLLPL